MKKTLLCLALALAFSTSLWAQKEIVPFKGTIKYKISHQSEQLDAATLAQQPQQSVVKISDTKLLVDNQAAKIVLDATEKKVYSLINLSQMGLGKYVVAETEEDLKNIKNMSDYIVTPTEETKVVQGYTTKKTIGSYITPEATVSFEAYCIKGLCPDFFRNIDNSFIKLDGFPLEYVMTIKNNANGMTIKSTSTIESMTVETIDPKEFVIAKSYKATTQDELRKIIEEYMQAFQE